MKFRPTFLKVIISIIIGLIALIVVFLEGNYAFNYMNPLHRGFWELFNLYGYTGNMIKNFFLYSILTYILWSFIQGNKKAEIVTKNKIENSEEPQINMKIFPFSVKSFAILFSVFLVYAIIRTFIGLDQGFRLFSFFPVYILIFLVFLPFSLWLSMKIVNRFVLNHPKIIFIVPFLTLIIHILITFILYTLFIIAVFSGGGSFWS